MEKKTKKTKSTKDTKAKKVGKTSKKELKTKDRKKVTGGKLPIPVFCTSGVAFSSLKDMKNKTKGEVEYDEELWKDGGPTITPIIPPRPQR